MERFAFKIDKVLKANLYKICRLCGIDNPEKVPIVQSSDEDELDVVDADAEPELSQKIKDLIGFTVYKDDKMPQFVCTICVDKINDFYEFREMCFSTDQQTRKLLGIKPAPKKNSQIKLEVKTEPAATEKNADKRGKKRRIEDFDNNRDIKEEMERINSNVSSLNKKKQRLPDESGRFISNSLNKKKKIQSLEEFDKCSGSQSAALNKKKLRLTEDAIPFNKKQMRLAVLKQKVQLQSVTEDEVKMEIKDEPSVIEPTSVLPDDQKFKQQCSICKQRFPTKVKLDRHKIVEHNPNIAKFFCTTCNEEVVKSNDIKSHQLWHKLSKTPYTCGLCDESLLTINLFTRHLSNHTQKLLTPILVFDRECSLCHETFVTNFLYNIHPCALRTRKCGGCNRKMKTDTECQLHASLCEKAYLIASKHVGGGLEAVCIKNENDVEAAVEDFTRNISVPSTMMPVVSLTRLPIEPNQKVNIASTSAAAVSAASAATPKSKKSSKKGISKKDLKRVDDLLKSTMDTLVSIKHEPEINVDAELHVSTPQPEIQQQLSSIANDGEHIEGINSDNNDDMHYGDDDFQNQDDDSNHSDYNTSLESAVQMHTGKEFAVKQEPRDEFHCGQEQHPVEINAVRIKKELPDTDVLGTPSKVPVLKLKIIKEHGTLNSSLVNENKEKGEKKKKKKKRKEAERAAADVANNPQANVTAALNTPDDSTDKLQSEPSMPLPGIVHIKQERIDEEYFEENATTHSTNAQPEATIMTSIPILQFQIACVSSGVEFDKGDANKETEAADIAQATMQEPEQQDIKPNREELDRLWQTQNITNSTESSTLSLAEGEHHTDAIVAHEKDDTTKQRHQLQKTARKSVATKSTSQRKINTAKAKLPNEQIPKIVAVSSGIELPMADKEDANESNTNETEEALNKATVELMTQVRIKSEPRDDYENEQNLEAITGSINYDEDATDQIRETIDHTRTEEPLFDTPSNSTVNNVEHSEEQAYINSIDFNNIRIKQEKDIDVSESQLTAHNFSHVSAFNGMSLTDNDEDGSGSGSAAIENEDMENEEEEEENEDEDEEEDDEDEDNEMPTEEVEEAREYREIDWPPLLGETANETFETPAEPKIDKPSFGLTIANVCSQAAVDFTKENTDCSPKIAIDTTQLTQSVETITESVAKTTSFLETTTSDNQTLELATNEIIENNTQNAAVAKEAILKKTDEIAVVVHKESMKVLTSSNVEENATAKLTATASLDETSSDTISGHTVENAEGLLEAQPVTNNKTNIAATEVHADAANEEQQNILNHEMCDSHTNSATLNIQTGIQPLTNSLPNMEISNAATTQVESYLEDISSNSCSIFSSIGNESSTNVADIPMATASSTLETTAMQVNHEETENLFNENIEQSISPAIQHAPQLATPALMPIQQQHQQHHALLIDNSNVNEIAENNNNANIERELLDDVNHYHNVENVNETSTAANESLPSASSSTSQSSQPPPTR